MLINRNNCYINYTGIVTDYFRNTHYLSNILFEMSIVNDIKYLNITIKLIILLFNYVHYIITNQYRKMV